MALLMSKALKDSIQRLEEWATSAKVDAHYPRFDHLVLVMFEHGRGVLLHDDAFTMDDPGSDEFCWVLTEHQGYHVFAKDELSACIELEEVNRIALRNPDAP